MKIVCMNYGNVIEFERKAIEATGIAQEQLRCPVSFHPGRSSAAPFEIVRLYLEAGGKPDKCVMSHLDSKIRVKINNQRTSTQLFVQ